MTDIYRTVYQVEVFSEGPWNGDGDLAAINYAITEGDCIGNVEQVAVEVVPPDRLEAELLRIGNDGTFFGDGDASTSHTAYPIVFWTVAKSVVLEGRLMGLFVIESDRERDFETGHPLYWSNRYGWGPIDTADTFGDTAGVNLPVGGHWVDEDGAWSRANEINNGCCECGEVGHCCEDCPTFMDDQTKETDGS